jgi:hypothetical protein
MNPSPSLAAAAPVGRRRPSHAPALATIAGAVLLPSLVMLAWILVRNGGHLTYPLDAPYTQLALAEQIARGHYGLNPGEPSSPSSSIAWPFLLAALSFLPLGDAAPLLLCLASNLATGGLLYALALECGVRVDRLRPPTLAAIALSLTLALNLAGLAAAGLEHSLHVALTLASLLGLVRFVRRDRVDGWWLAAIVALPLVRFEAAAALAADILVLLAFRKYAHALGVALAGAAVIGGFALYLHSMGLPPLPSSVLARSAVASAGLELAEGGPVALLRAVWSGFRANLLAYGATHILAMLVAVGWGVARAGIGGGGGRPSPARTRPDWAGAVAFGFFAVVALAQVTGGSLSSFSRYEIYVLALGVGALLVVFAPEADAFLARIRPARCAAFCLSVLVLFAGYALRTVDTLSAAGNSHDLQYQLFRYATEFYRAPVAIDHPGRINLRNPHTVLDLSHLGTEAGRRAAAAGNAAAWMDEEVRRRGIGLALTGDGAAEARPAAWRPVARLEVRRPVEGTGSGTVTFHAVRPADAPPILEALHRLRPTLPPGARLVLLDPAGDGAGQAAPPRSGARGETGPGQDGGPRRP